MTASSNTAPTQRHSALWANTLCLLSMLIWAAGLPATKFLVDPIPPVALTALRTGIAGIVLVVAWALIEGTATLRRAPWGRGLAVGSVVMGLGAVLVAVALDRTDAVTVAIITATMPIVGIALECLLDGRRLTAGLIAGLVLSVAGGVVALGADADRPALGTGALAAFGSVLAFTWGSRATITSFPLLTPLGRTAITVAGAGIVMTVAALVLSAAGLLTVDWHRLGWAEAGALGLSSIGSIAISQTLWIMAVGALGIGISSLHMNATPFYVMLIACLLGAPWNWPQAAGAAIVVAGVLVAQGLVPLWRART